MTELQLPKEAIVSSESGRLLVIDPSYLDGFDRSGIDRLKLQREIERLEIDLEEEDVINLHSGLKQTHPSEFLEKLREYRKRDEEVRRRQIESSIEYLRNPVLLQGDSYVLFNKKIMGNSAIVRVPMWKSLRREIQVIFFPESRLKRVLGYSLSEVGERIITDPENVRILEEVGEHAYCFFEVPRGEYSCRFVNDIRENRVLSIRRKR